MGDTCTGVSVLLRQDVAKVGCVRSEERAGRPRSCGGSLCRGDEVDRDDVHDHGSSDISETVRQLKAKTPHLLVAS